MAVVKFLISLSMLLFTSLCCAQNLTIYCEEDYPVQFYDKSGELTGFSIELVREMQRRLGLTEKILVVPWSRGMDKLMSEPNTMLITMARTPERESLFQWVGPVVSVEYGLYGKSNSAIKLSSMEDAKKVRLIGVYRNDIRDQTLTRLGFTNLDRAASNVSSFKKLMIGRVDLYTDTKIGAESLALALGHKISDVKLIYPLFKSHLYYGVSKGTDPGIVAKWNATLEEIKKDKTFLRIQRKYFSEQEITHQ